MGPDKKLIFAFFKYVLFWTGYFLFSRLIFLLANYNLSGNLSAIELAGTFYHGIKMDLSMAGYLTLLPGLILTLSFLLSPKILFRILRIYTLIILVLVTFLNVTDLGLYPHWGTRVGISAFNYTGDLKAALSNVTLKEAVLAIMAFSLYFFLFTWIFNKLFRKSFHRATRQKWFIAPVTLLFTAALIIPIRGGLGTSPINQSTVSFSNKLFVNHSALNYLWNFGNTVERRNSYHNPCLYFPVEEARKTFESVESRRTNSDSLYIQTHVETPPNVILVILESFSNKVISSLGGEYGVCPNMDSIASEGIIFPSFYAAGNRSDRGMSAILGSYPSLMDLSIMRFPDKSVKLTPLSEYFNRHDYHTSFYYGGDIDFYNLKSFVLQGNYDQITSLEQFPKELQYLCSWGVPDEYVFRRVLNDIQKKKDPFFSVVYTLSSHTPFDVPVEIIEGRSNEAKFLNSLAYTDQCLGEFIQQLKTSEIWENTLVVITSDHGALDPGPTDITDPETYRIPLIWAGGVVKEPAVIDRIGGQVDLIPTMLSQLGWERDKTKFGHNLFTSPSYAFYMLDLGWGYLEKEGECFYDQGTEKFIHFKPYNEKEPNTDFAKSYLQLLYEDFLSL